MEERRIGNKRTKQWTCLLNENSLDAIVLEVQEYAKSVKIDPVAASRYGFLIDNALDRWMENGGRGQELKVTLGRRLFQAYISIEMAGEKNDPYPNNTADYGIGGNEISVMTSQLPYFEYRDGSNVLTLNLKREQKMIHQIGIVAAIALVVGVLGNLGLSETLRQDILTSVVDPIISMFFNLLRCIAGPMVFLSVVWGICGIGDSRIFGRIGKAVLAYSVGITLLGAIVGACSFPWIGNGLTDGALDSGTFSSVFALILEVVPSSVVEPFTTGNTLQIIFLATAMGIALITISSKVRQLTVVIDQLNHIFQHLMGAVSKLVPYIVFLLLTEMIWTGSFSVILSMWKFFAAMIGTFLVIALLLCGLTALQQRAGFFTVIKKNMSAFVVALSTASSAAAFESNLHAAKKRYGISNEMAGFSIPLGMIMHNPVAACYDVLLIIYFAASYNVTCSFSWLIVGVIVSTTVAISTPPIPNGAVIGYALLFAQMGIPEEAMVLVLVLDVITDFVVTAFECFVLPISLSNIAGATGQLNVDILRDKTK